MKEKQEYCAGILSPLLRLIHLFQPKQLDFKHVVPAMCAHGYGLDQPVKWTLAPAVCWFAFQELDFTAGPHTWGFWVERKQLGWKLISCREIGPEPRHQINPFQQWNFSHFLICKYTSVSQRAAGCFRSPMYVGSSAIWMDLFFSVTFQACGLPGPMAIMFKTAALSPALRGEVEY